ncbi:hypothetical protein ACFLSQ_12025 [Bacteroidota bacterium]
MPIISIARSSDSLCILTDDGCIFTSTNNGQNWKKNDYYIERYWHLYSSAIINGNIIIGRTFGYLLSSDFGENWSIIQDGFSSKNEHIYSLLTHENSIFAGTSSGLYVSFDSGISWGNINIGLSYASH